MIALLSEGLGKCRVQEKIKIQNEDLRTVTYLLIQLGRSYLRTFQANLQNALCKCIHKLIMQGGLENGVTHDFD